MMRELLIGGVSGLIGGVFGFISAAWASHIAYFFPFGYLQWKLKLWCLRNNPNCKNLKDTKIRQELAWELYEDSEHIKDKLNEIMERPMQLEELNYA